MKPEVGGWLTRGCEALSLVSLPLPRSIERARERERERERASVCVSTSQREREILIESSHFFSKNGTTQICRKDHFIAATAATAATAKQNKDLLNIRNDESSHRIEGYFLPQQPTKSGKRHEHGGWFCGKNLSAVAPRNHCNKYFEGNEASSGWKTCCSFLPEKNKNNISRLLFLWREKIFLRSHLLFFSKSEFLRLHPVIQLSEQMTFQFQMCWLHRENQKCVCVHVREGGEWEARERVCVCVYVWRWERIRK